MSLKTIVAIFPETLERTRFDIVKCATADAAHITSGQVKASQTHAARLFKKLVTIQDFWSKAEKTCKAIWIQDWAFLKNVSGWRQNHILCSESNQQICFFKPTLNKASVGLKFCEQFFMWHCIGSRMKRSLKILLYLVGILVDFQAVFQKTIVLGRFISVNFM